MACATRGEIESEVANAVARYHREQQGRGPVDVRAHLFGDLVVVRCTGVLTPTEARLAATEEGRRLVRSARHELRSISHGEAEHAVCVVVGCTVLRSYCDIDVAAAEQVEVYVLAEDFERRLARSGRQAPSRPPGAS